MTRYFACDHCGWHWQQAREDITASSDDLEVNVEVRESIEDPQESRSDEPWLRQMPYSLRRILFG